MAQSQDIVVFAGLVITAAAWALVHLSLWLRVRRTPTLGWALRALAVLPPVTPFAGFRARVFVRSVLWCVFAATYLVLRTLP